MTEVQTVTEKIPSTQMGITLPHEHILLNALPIWAKPSKDYEWLVDAKVTMDVLGDILHHELVCKDNLILNDPEIAAKELQRFKATGGRTIVELTNRGLSPRPTELRDLSRKTGLNIIEGCGYYTSMVHPTDMASRTLDQLAEEMIRDITQGIDGTGVKAGIIGEIGTSHPITENERKVLRAAAHAQKNTGVSVNVHISMNGNHGLQVVRLLESGGVDPSRIIISHMDEVQDPTMEQRRAVADRGAYVEFDCFGEEDYSPEWNFIHPRDTERVSMLKRLIDLGYIDNLLISHDVCAKMYTRTYGGYGYDHIQKTILPMLRQLGVSDTEINHLMVENPRRAIAH